MGLKDETFSIRGLLRRGLAADKSAIGAPQGRLALLRTLPRCLGTPAGQNFTQVADSDIDRGSQIYRGTQVDLATSAIVHAIVAEPQYFGAHASLPNRSAGRMEVGG